MFQGQQRAAGHPGDDESLQGPPQVRDLQDPPLLQGQPRRPETHGGTTPSNHKEGGGTPTQANREGVVRGSSGLPSDSNILFSVKGQGEGFHKGVGE